MQPDRSLEICDWPDAEARVMPLRFRVFVEEQGVPAEIELDEFDPVSRHAVLTDAADRVIATGRLLPDGHIGRMAVDAAHRNQGLGSRVLLALIGEAERAGMVAVVLNAQVGALAFYVRHGFIEEGPRFMEAGIEHQAMMRRIQARSSP